MDILKAVREAGVVGAGGAGFPTHVKLDARIDYDAKRVTLPLSQHVGAPAEAVVKPGDKITVGQVVADIPEGKLAARIHASIDGSVTAVNGAIIIEQS